MVSFLNRLYAPEAKILVVDDTRMNLIMMKELLKQTGIQIDTADSGRECLFLTEINEYHIIFLDIRMPEMDGFETLSRMLTQKKNHDTPVVALTANTLSETSNEYVDEGFSDYLSKPIEIEMLEGILLKYLPKDLVQEKESEERDLYASAGGMDEEPVIPGLDVAMGIQACGTGDIFQKALKEFYLTANERIHEIEHYIQTESYIDYTIKVHALKSTARIIGAMQLSEMACYLEECGNQGNIHEINEKNTALLTHYNELMKNIGAYINKKVDKHALPLIERESLMDALHTIYEYVEVFDFDGADSIMEMLDDYIIPLEYDAAIKKLKVLLIDVERDGILQHINAMEECSIDIPGIDTQSALEALGGSVVNYISSIKVFAEDEKDRLLRMDECIKSENTTLYTIYAHSLKSSAAIIGAMALSKLAEQLEMEGKKGNFKYIQETHDELSFNINRVIDNLVCFLSQYNDGETQEKEQGNKEFLLDMLIKINESLKEYDIDTADEALNRLNNMQWSSAVTIMITKLDQAMMTFDYENAQLLAGMLLDMEEKVI